MPDETTQTVLTVTEPARQMVVELRAEAEDGEDLALFVEAVENGPGEYAYDMYFADRAEAEPDDLVLEETDLTVVVPAASVERLQGATLDVEGDEYTGGLVMVNPNRPSPAAGLDLSADALDLSGDLAQQVLTVLAEEINPAIGSHGGGAELVAIEEDVVYLRLSGGCQGCASAQITLKQGIERAILELVPAVSRVVDVTDHASGASPYYS